MLLAIDDLHWLDPATAGALAVAIRGTAELPVTVVAASRAGDAGPASSSTASSSTTTVGCR